MRAIMQSRYGTVPEDVLRLDQAAKPAIGANEVLVQVRAAGVDRGTWHLMAGQPYLMRILGFGFRGPKNPVPGLDVAGTVVAVGAGRHQVRGRATRCSASPGARSPNTPPRGKASWPASPPG